MATIYIDNKPYEVSAEQNLLHACLSLGFDIPYFCWHPAMNSVGACRQCAVKVFKDENDTRGKIVMSCMTPAADGTRLSIDDPDVLEFRAHVIEWLMVNHPHDCPVCDEGGECHLQDMTVMTGQDYRRFRFKKRTFRNQDLGPLVAHEMNRCIQCYRCVRFYRDTAGGRDFDVFGWHDHVYFGREGDGTLESEFSGNLVEVCPTGVFTDKTLARHYTRKWDLQTAPSICVHCGLGCNTIPGERYGMLRRIRNRYNREINGYFLCDRGRYGYEFVNGERRIRQPLARAGQELSPADRQTALGRVSAMIGQGGVIGIGSPRASLEGNFALRTLVGPENFFAGVGDGELELLTRGLEILRAVPGGPAAVEDVRNADAVLVLGEDVASVAPVITLALRRSVLNAPLRRVRKMHIFDWDDAAVREAIQQERGPLFVATPAPTRIDGLAAQAYRAAPRGIARLGFAVAHEIDAAAPAVVSLDDDAVGLAKRIGDALRAASRPVVITGTACGNADVLNAAASVVAALRAAGREARLCLTVPECNSLGLAMMAPRPLNEALAAVREGKARAAIVLENDLYRRMERSAADALLAGARVVALDCVATATTDKAEVVLPAGAFAETSGTLVNHQGRAQRFVKVFNPAGEIQEGWRWLRDAMTAAGKTRAGQWADLDAVLADMAVAIPALAGAAQAAPPASYRADNMRIPRQPHRYSGRTAMNANVTVFEPQPRSDGDEPMNFSMEGYEGQPPPALIKEYWSPGWNSVQALNKFQQEVGGLLRGGTPGVPLIAPAPNESVSNGRVPNEPVPTNEPAGPTSSPRFASRIPDAFKPRLDEWLVVPLHEVFGSDELSMFSPPIASLAPQPYLALGPHDAQRLGLAEGQAARLSLGGGSWTLPVRVVATLPQGVAGVPAGLQALAGAVLPAWGRVLRCEI